MLDSAEAPVRIFFRDDDAGWENGKLIKLLNRFEHAGMPIDLAVIPENLDHWLADELLARWQRNKQLLGLHQHGFSHGNHELNGRKCEFGVSRTKIQQERDIAKGRAYLQKFLGEALDPIFTPPWNRCTQDTVQCLEELEFKLLSRDVTANKLETSSIQEAPVHIDWSRIIKSVDEPLQALALALKANLTKNKITGVMLHHADMEGQHLGALSELLVLLSGHENVRSVLLKETLE